MEETRPSIEDVSAALHQDDPEADPGDLTAYDFNLKRVNALNRSLFRSSPLTLRRDADGRYYVEAPSE